MSARLAAVDAAKRALEFSEVRGLDDVDLAATVGQLRSALRGLLQLVETQPRSVRLAAQHDQEFVNLARAARMEIHAARGSLKRLDRFEQALTDMLGPVEDGGQE